MVLRAVSNSLVIFLSTLSLRRATKGSLHGGPVGIFLSTLSLRRATLVHITVDYCTNISIHALLTESDLETVQCYFADWFISIHALLTESDPMTERMVAGFEISIHALLTESDRGAPGLGQPDSNFYPRSPYGERLRGLLHHKRQAKYFYPRSPYGERLVLLFFCTLLRYFYPRSPYGERP